MTKAPTKTAAKAAADKTAETAAAATAPSDAQLAAAAKTIANAGTASTPAAPPVENMANPTPGAAQPSLNPAQETPAPTAAANKKGALDHGRLAGLADAIERDAASTFTDLRHRLESEEGLKIVEKPAGSGIHVATMGGISAESTSGIRHAVENWANAARRAALADAPVVSGRT